MHNIKFNYLYRDGSYFKKWASVIFFNPHGLSPDVKLGEVFHSTLWGDELFIAHQVRVPEVFLFSKGGINSDDHCFHEFDSVEASDETPNDQYGRTFSEFMSEVARESKGGWRAFDPLDRLAT